MIISIVGPGNVGTHLAKALKNAGHSIAQIVGRDKGKSLALAEVVDAEPISVQEALHETDVVLLTVSDNAIEPLSHSVHFAPQAVVAHTSGATPMSILEGCASRYGVFYPCQTFSSSDELSLERTPFLVEGSDSEAEETLTQLAQSLSCEPVRVASSEQRLQLHLAAVFGSNFANHLLLHAQRILAEANLPMDVLRVLVDQTIDKAFRIGPHEAQTGPARRHDTATLDRHMRLLANSESAAKIYETLSRSIEETY